MSKTSTSICWILVDERDIAGDPLDHDAFEITDSSAAAPAATARRVREIASASGYTVDSVHVTTSGNLTSVRDALTESGFGDVVPVSLAAATRAWAMGTARLNGHHRLAVCLFGCDSASLSLVDTCSGTAQSVSTIISRDGLSLIDWLKVSFGGCDFRPEALYLIGSRGKLDAFAGRLERVLAIPVLATDDAQLALARGAVFSDATPDDLVAPRRPRFGSNTRSLAAVAGISAITLFTVSAAAGPIPLVGNAFPVPEPPSPDIAGAAAAAIPVALPAPPPPPPEEPPPAPERWVAPPTADVATPRSVPTPVVADTVGPAATPVERLPDVQPVQHLPESAPAPAPGPAPTADPPAPMPPPPPVDPLAGALSPLFSGLP